MIFTPARLIMTIFMMHSIVMTNWFPRIPDMQAKLEVGTGDLSLGLLGASIGTLVALPLAGQIIEWLSPRRTILVAFVFYCAAYALRAGRGASRPCSPRSSWRACPCRSSMSP